MVALMNQDLKDAAPAYAAEDRGLCLARMIVNYYEQMNQPKPFPILTGEELKLHQRELQGLLLKSLNLDPLPDRVLLDVHYSELLDHPWCTVRRVYYQIWPGVYANGLLYMSKILPERPAPAMLCPHGYFKGDNTWPDEQMRSLTFAKNGYVTFSPTMFHYQDPLLGVYEMTGTVWSNMRAVDFLQSLPEVDANRIGISGVSGGGHQTQLMVALDNRLKAATIAGYTCEFRDIIFPYMSNVGSIVYAGVMRYTDQPEISTLGFATPVQYLAMNDFAGRFRYYNFPSIQQLFTANGLPEKVECAYWPTGHSYDKPKRERTYWWMDRWLKHRETAAYPKEPALTSPYEPAKGIVANRTYFPADLLLHLSASVPQHKGFQEISSIYEKSQRYGVPRLSSRSDWIEYRTRMSAKLRDLLGMDAALAPRLSVPQSIAAKEGLEGVSVERVDLPSEDEVLIPTVILAPEGKHGKLPVILHLSGHGSEKLLREIGRESVLRLAAEGNLVVLPDVRFFGELSFDNLAGKIGPALMKHHQMWRPDLPSGKSQQRESLMTAWWMSTTLWGRPVYGMACTDIEAVLRQIESRPDVRMEDVRLISRGSGPLAISALFSAILDARIGALDIDLENYYFARSVDPWAQLAPAFVLRYGDVLEWAACVADRKLTIHQLAAEAGDADWLSSVFEIAGNGGGLKIGNSKVRRRVAEDERAEPLCERGEDRSNRAAPSYHSIRQRGAYKEERPPMVRKRLYVGPKTDCMVKQPLAYPVRNGLDDAPQAPPGHGQCGA